MSGVDAYKRTLNQTGSSRDTEFRLLGQVTTALMNAQKVEGEIRKDPAKMAQYADALTWNKQVWDLFVEDCGAAGNQLPRELRAAIVSLGIWVSKETALALDGNGDIDSLIAVNHDIMKGLRPPATGDRPQGQAAPQQQPAGAPIHRTVIDSA